MLRAEINRLTQMNDEHSLKSKQFEREIDELKEKNEFLENEILTMKSSQAHHQDLQTNIERLQAEIHLSVHIVLGALRLTRDVFFFFYFRSKNVKMPRC